MVVIQVLQVLQIYFPRFPRDKESMPLNSIKHRKVYLGAMTQIRKCIVQGEYNLGDKLPSENELTEIFQISRPSVREALCGLTALGLIEARPGEGTTLNRRAHFQQWI